MVHVDFEVNVVVGVPGSGGLAASLLQGFGAELQVVGFEDCLCRNPKPWYTRLVVSKSSLAKSKPRYKQILCTTVQRPTDKHGLKVRVAVNPEPAASKHR